MHILLLSIVLLILSLDIKADALANYDDLPRLSKQRNQCIPVEIPQCKRWYDQRRPPNIYTATTAEYRNVKSLVSQLSLLPKNYRECVNDATFLLCALYSPVCIKGSKPLKPCRELCVKWRKNCRRLDIFSNVALPDKLRDCNELPEFHNSMCIQPSSFITKEQEEKKSNKDSSKHKTCDCKDFKQPTPKYRHFRKAAYVIEATINSRETLANGNTKIILDVLKIYKQGKISIKFGKLRMWSSCLCHKDIQYGDKKYFLIVDENHHKKKKNLEISKTTLVLDATQYENKIDKWYKKCLKRKSC
ncbi:secreted frizzled-related protein 3-like [Clytia hemisphaerica]|uniref:Secreted frizzled related protein n=1 Tax=Clytia hemisphaerica TaxID=252671 RepID=A0A7M5TPS5_9CNID|eukprot:TCONS_00060163-protein